MDVNPLHHGTTGPGTGPSTVVDPRRIHPDGGKGGAHDSARRHDDAEATGSTDAAPSVQRPPDASAEALLQAHDTVWNALVDEDGHREGTTAHVSANRGAAAYESASKAG